MMRLSREEVRIMRTTIRCSQSKLAIMCGIGRFKISQFELGYVDMTLPELRRIQDTLIKLGSPMPSAFGLR